MNTKLVPYFTFGGVLDVQTFDDAKMANIEETKDRIIHACLTTDEFTLMASDSHPEHGHPVTQSNGVSLSFVGTDTEKLTKYFTKLAEGGVVEMPLEKQFWGDMYGACKDKFGVHWMVNISQT